VGGTGQLDVKPITPSDLCGSGVL